MMAENAERERHNVNLSRQVWGELKLRAFQEGMSASELVAYVVERFTNESYIVLRLPRYQPRSADEDRLGRTVFFPAGVWEKAQVRAAQCGTSISGLIEHLLKQYLGLLPDSQEEPDQPSAGRTVQIGEERVYLGENPLRIDLKTGKPKEN
jgi:hypothetical protein